MKIKKKSNSQVKKGDYLAIKEDGERLLFYQGEELVGECEKPENFLIPEGRKNVKARVSAIGSDEYNLEKVGFVHLHVHTEYSLLDGANRVKDVARLVQGAAAITDHGGMSGVVAFSKEMKKAGKQPIYGFEAYLETKGGKLGGNHLLIIAKNEKGYKNLMKLSSGAYNNFYYKPHVSYEKLEEHSEGLIVTSACLGGEIPQLLMKDRYDEARELAMYFKDLFADDFYLEIQRHNIGFEEDKVNEGLIKLSKETEIKLVATSDSHYTNEEDKEVHEMLLCLQTGVKMSDERRMRFPGDGYHLHTPEEMQKKFADLPEALDSTVEIAEKCNGFDLELGKLYLPEFEVPNEMGINEYFENLAWDGFNKRFENKPELTNPVYIDRMKTEIEIIENMGFASYFLIVADFISYAKNKGIMVGPGRGSAVGSLVSYSMGIVDLDPIPYGLLFERFLNPDRVSMPDIDVDFCYERRDEVIQYVKDKYGEESVSKIITFGTLGAKAAVRDMARVMDYPYDLGDRIAKAIPMVVNMTIEKAMEDNPDLMKMYNNEPDVKKVIDVALKVEGLARHASQHACGVIIAPSAVDNYLPEILMGKDGSVKERTSQVVMTEVEDLGLLKMDFLGLRTMTVIGQSIESINKNTVDSVQYYDIPYVDPYVYQDISRGKTYGVFQLESQGMRSFMVELYSDVDMRIKGIENKYGFTGFMEPVGAGDVDAYVVEMTKLGQELYERLIAGISLYRPGPMDYIPDYIEGMKHPYRITYDTPELEPILSTTYGTIVYQEQVMQIVQKLAGYTLARADIVRRAMGKKKIEVMNAEKDVFINGKLDKDGNVEVPGCIRNGVSKDAAEKIWHKMEDFSKYAFNKSHSAGYALIGAITAWLKHYYPIDFMASTLNSFIDNSDKLKSYISVCKDMNISLLPPNVNESNERFSRSKDDIIFGLKGIRNIGKASEMIIEERDERGFFEDYQELVVRLAKHQKANKKVVEGLIFAGALDNFDGTRSSKMAIVETLLKVGSKEREHHARGQVSIFDVMPSEAHLLKVEIPDIREFDKRYKLEKEKEFAGFYVTEHPMDEYEDFLKNQNISKIGFFVGDSEDDEMEEERAYGRVNKMQVQVAGIVKDIKIFYTKKDNKPLYVFSLEDTSGEIGCILFSDKIEVNSDKIVEGKIVLLNGILKDDDRGMQIIVNTMTSLEALKEKERKKVVVIKDANNSQLTTFSDTLRSKSHYRGDTPVYLVINGKRFKSNDSIMLNASTQVFLTKTFGKRYEVIELN